MVSGKALIAKPWQEARPGVRVKLLPQDGELYVFAQSAVQMIDLHVPTTDGRELMLTRYTEPEPELALLLHKLKFVLPDQPKPKITALPSPPPTPMYVPTFAGRIK